MDPKWQALFFGLAILFFLLDAFTYRPKSPRAPIWTPLGLACFAFPFFYGVVVAGW